MFRNYRAGLLFMLCICILCACGKSPQLAKLPADAVILAFGDSITFGTGVAPEDSYPGVLERQTGRRVVSAGVPGEMTVAGRARLASVLDEHKPALMILCLGGNDFLQRQDEARTTENLRAMLSLARDRGVAVLLVAVPRLGMGLEVPKFYGELARDFNLPLEEKILKQILSTNSLKSDPIHPNKAGYAMLADAVASMLRDAGAL